MNKKSMQELVALIGLILMYPMFCVAQKQTARSVRLFETMAELRAYAKSLPEYPDPDTSDWTNPSFNAYFQSRRPGYFKRITNFFHVRKDAWRLSEFKKLLEQVVHMRAGIAKKGRFFFVMNPVPSTKFIIMGDLRGAFHSLVRNLEALQQDGIIDEHFKVVKSDYYLVFDGNTINGGAYGLDTLTLVIRLIVNNPDHVICDGAPDKAKWEDQTLEQELKERFAISDVRAMKGLIDKFVDSCPLALYLVAQRTESQVDLVRIGSYGLSEYGIEEKNSAHYFLDPEVQTIYVDDKEKTSAGQSIIRAIIRTESMKQEKSKQLVGLKKAKTEGGAVVWNLLSGPIGAYRVLYGFFFDAFVKLTSAASITDWTLTLYDQDLRDPKGISLKKIYNLLTGAEYIDRDIAQQQARLFTTQKQQLEDGLRVTLNEFKDFKITRTEKPPVVTVHRPEAARPVEAKPKDQIKSTLVAVQEGAPTREVASTKEIVPIKEGAEQAKKELVFGSLMDLSRNQRGISEQSIGGIQLAFDEINKMGGIKGNSLSLMTLDDEYDPKVTPDRLKAMLEQYHINRLLMPLGSPTLETYLDQVRAGKVCVLFPNTGSSLFRSPDLKYLINFRASYLQEGEALARYALESLNAKKIVLFYQKDVESIDGILKFFKMVGFTNYVEVTYDRQAVNLEKQVAKIISSAADTIIFLSLPSTALELMRQMGVHNFAGKNLLGWSDLISETFQKFSRSRGLTVVLSSVVPNPYASMLPIIKKYREGADSKGLVKDGDSLEGYINANILAEILKRIDGPVTNEKIISAAESLVNVDLGGITLNFDPQYRQLSPFIWLNTGDDDWQKISWQAVQKPVSPEKVKSEGKVPATTSTPAKVPEPVTMSGQSFIQTSSVKGASFLIGSTMDLTKGGKASGQAINKTVELIFAQANKAQAIPGINLRWQVLDDESVPQNARKNVEKLIQDKADILLMPYGARSFTSYVDLVKDKKLLVIFPVPGTRESRAPELKYCIHFGPSYLDEAAVLTHHVVSTIKPLNVAIFYQDDSLGRAMFQVAKTICDNKKIVCTPVAYSQNTTSFVEQAKAIVDSRPDGIGLFAPEDEVKKLLEQLQDPSIKDKQFFVGSWMSQSAIKKYFTDASRKYIATSVVPNPETSSMQIVQEYRKMIENTGITRDTMSLQAYINASLFVDGINVVQPITKEKIIAAFEGLKDYEFKGLTLSFDTDNRQLCNTLWLNIGSGDWQEVTVKKAELAKPPVIATQQKEKGEQAGAVQDVAEVITIGSTLDLSKSDKIMGNIIKTVFEEFFDMVNRDKLLGARTVKIYILDDEYSVPKARANAQKLITDYNILAMLMPLGSSNLQGYLDLVNSGQVDVLFPMADSPAFRKPDLKNIINFSASGLEVGYVMIKNTFKASAIAKLILFYEAITGGILDGAKDALTELHMQNYSEVPFSAADVDYSLQAKKIKDENPDAIMFLAGITPALSLVRLLGTDFLIGKTLIGGSVFLNVDSFKKNLRDKGINMVIPSLVPNPRMSELQIVKDFRAFVRASNLPDDPIALQAYMSARMFIEIIKKIQGAVTKAKIIEVAEQFKGFDLGGISLMFDPQTRRLINSLWIDFGKDEWQEGAIGKGVKAP